MKDIVLYFSLFFCTIFVSFHTAIYRSPRCPPVLAPGLLVSSLQAGTLWLSNKLNFFTHPTPNYFQNSSNKQMFSHLKPACCAYPTQVHPACASHW